MRVASGGGYLVTFDLETMCRIALLVALITGALPGPASAECVSLGVGTIARYADALFSGTVTNIEGEAVAFNVDRVWKGPVTQPMTIYNLAGSVERFELTVGVKYLVLAVRASDDEQLSLRHGRTPAFVIRQCGSGTRGWNHVSNREVKQLGWGRPPRRP